MRFVNNMEQEEVLSFQKEDWMKEVYRSNVIEEKGDLMIPDKDGVYHVALREFEIATFGIVRYVGDRTPCGRNHGQMGSGFGD